MSSDKEINKGSIVNYQSARDANTGPGWYRVSCKTSSWVNLCGVFSGKVYFKRIPIEDVTEDEAAWYKQWQESETYKCM